MPGQFLSCGFLHLIVITFYFLKDFKQLFQILYHIILISKDLRVKIYYFFIPFLVTLSPGGLFSSRPGELSILNSQLVDPMVRRILSSEVVMPSSRDLHLLLPKANGHLGHFSFFYRSQQNTGSYVLPRKGGLHSPHLPSSNLSFVFVYTHSSQLWFYVAL